MEIQFPAIIFYLINFGIIVVALQKLLYKPIRSVLNQRADKIEQGLKAAEASIKKETQVEQEAEAKLKEAQKTAAQILKDAKKQAAKKSEAVIAKAKESAKQAIVKERQSFETYVEQEKAALNKAYAQSVTQAARRLLQESLTDQDINKIVDKQIQQLKQSTFA